MSDDFRFRIIQDGIVVAGGSSPTQGGMLREMSHYAAVYAEDGPIERIETRAGKSRWKRHSP